MAAARTDGSSVKPWIKLSWVLRVKMAILCPGCRVLRNLRVCERTVPWSASGGFRETSNNTVTESAGSVTGMLEKTFGGRAGRRIEAGWEDPGCSSKRV